MRRSNINLGGHQADEGKFWRFGFRTISRTGGYVLYVCGCILLGADAGAPLVATHQRKQSARRGEAGGRDQGGEGIRCVGGRELRRLLEGIERRQEIIVAAGRT